MKENISVDEDSDIGNLLFDVSRVVESALFNWLRDLCQMVKINFLFGHSANSSHRNIISIWPVVLSFLDYVQAAVLAINLSHTLS